MAAGKYSIRRDQWDTITFTPLRRKHVIFIPDAARLDDIELSCFGCPNVDPSVRDKIFVGPNNIRWLLNNVDITDALLSVLANGMKSLPPALLKSSYLKGVEDNLALISLVGLTIGVDVEDLRSKAQRFAQEGLEKLMTKFGDRSVGWSGILHPVLYLFHAIPIAPISLSSVWQLHISSAPGQYEKELRALALQQIQITQGLSADGKIDPAEALPFGLLRYGMTSVHENPLKKPLEDIAQRLKQIDVQLEEMRVSYLGPAQDALAQASAEADSGLTACRTSLDDIREMVVNLRP